MTSMNDRSGRQFRMVWAEELNLCCCGEGAMATGKDGFLPGVISTSHSWGSIHREGWGLDAFIVVLFTLMSLASFFSVGEPRSSRDTSVLCNGRLVCCIDGICVASNPNDPRRLSELPDIIVDILRELR